MSILEIDELATDAEASKKKTKMTLKQLVQMGEEMQRLQECIDSSEEYAMQLKKEYNAIAEQQLPEAMNMLGLKYFGLNDGSEINIQDIVSCKINEENREAAHAWLRVYGHGDLIKNEIKAVFGKNEDDLASEFFDYAQAKAGGLVQREERVHPQTLKAFITSQLEAGTQFPAETFKLYIGKVARLQKPKKK